MILDSNLLSSFSNRQVVISRSSIMTDYCDVANVIAKTSWLCNLLHELHTSPTKATIMYYDKANFYISSNLLEYQQTIHIEFGIHFVRDLASLSQLEFF